jgi:hypothetical protein
MSKNSSENKDNVPLKQTERTRGRQKNKANDRK